MGHLAHGVERGSFRGRTKLFYKDRGTDHLEKGEVDPGAARDKGLKEGIPGYHFSHPSSGHSLTANSPSEYCLLRHLHMKKVNPSG